MANNVTTEELTDALKEAYTLLLQMSGTPRTASQSTYCKLRDLIAKVEKRGVLDVQDDYNARSIELGIAKGWIK